MGRVWNHSTNVRPRFRYWKVSKCQEIPTRLLEYGCIGRRRTWRYHPATTSAGISQTAANVSCLYTLTRKIAIHSISADRLIGYINNSSQPSTREYAFTKIFGIVILLRQDTVTRYRYQICSRYSTWSSWVTDVKIWNLFLSSPSFSFESSKPL